MIRSEKIDQVCASMFAVQRDAGQPKKDSKANAGKFSYDYLSLPGLIEHLAPHLQKWSLYVTQEVRGAPGKAEVYTTVWHSGSQQWIEFGPAMVPARSEDPQDHGGAITYCRRYALAAVFNIAADEDDDAAPKGKSGTGRGSQPSQAIPPPRQASAREKTSPPAGSTRADDVAEAPSPYGEGGDGASATPVSAVNTDGLWGTLLTAVNGKTREAARVINEVNGTDYTYATARADATWDMLVAAIASLEVKA